MENVNQQKENIDFNKFIELSNRSFDIISNKTGSSSNSSKGISCQPGSHSTSKSYGPISYSYK